MISPDYVRTLARYNAWQNESLIAAADSLDAAARTADRGAFFGSIAGTLNHLLWADRIWMSRLAGLPKPQQPSIPRSVAETADWESYKTARGSLDGEIAAWAAGLDAADLAGDLTWFSGAANREVSKPRWVVIAHLFNHQAHHRGQVHALLTAAGARPQDTDLFFLPDT